MSDSTLVKTPQAVTEPLSLRRPGLAAERNWRWWVLSLLLHFLFYGALFYFTPVREIFLGEREKEKFKVAARADRVEEIIEHIREDQAAELRTKVEELLDIQEELQEIQAEKNEQFAAIAQELSADAPAKALAAQLEALQAQAAALSNQARSSETAPPAPDTWENDPKFKALEAAKRNQAKAAQAQSTAGGWLGLSTTSFATAKQAQDQANEAQAKADEQQDTANALWTKYRDSLRNEIKLTADAQKAAANASNAVARAAVAAEKLALAQENARRAEEAATVAAAELATANASGNKNQVAQAQRAADRAKTLSNQAAANRDRATAEAAKTAAAATAATAEAAKAQAAADAAAARTQDLATQARAAEQVARQLQQQAHAAQQLAHATLTEALTRATTDPASASATNLIAQVPPVTAVARPTLAGQNIAELYATAVRTEDHITQTYKGVRAAELAMIRKIPIEQALHSTDVAKPVRPELDGELLTNPVRTPEAADAHNRELQRALAETESMVAAARRMLELVKGSPSQDQGLDAKLAQIKADAELNAELMAAAKQGGERAKDLTALMKGQRESATPSTGSGDDGGTPASDSSAGSPATGPNALILPEMRLNNVVPGRIIRSGAAKADWMFVDSWYIIGPFPNPSRRNVDRKFPPETVVDLDARYVGKNDQPISWRFTQTDRPTVVPHNAEPYGIWYAYTELWLEKEADLWIAVGSDDKSTVWVEGQPVWISGGAHKSWRWNEGLRKVHFKKGLNRILYRIENGHLGMAFSFAICLRGDNLQASK